MSEVQRREHTIAVWEITLKCNLACSHCGSRAGKARQKELSTEEAVDLVDQLAEIGINEVTLIGGEAFLRRDWLDIARHISQRGMLCSMTTGAYGLTRKTARHMKEAGIRTVSVSVDGLEETHDRQRGKQGSFKQAIQAMGYLHEAGLVVGSNSQINRLSAPEFPLLYQVLKGAGMVAWQIQLTVPMGNAADNPEMLLQPSELLDLYPMLAEVIRRAYLEGVHVQPGNNIGYYGPYEKLLRNSGNEDGAYLWQGCQAGLSVLGLEADGSIKGCPSLPTRAYTGGNIRERRLRDIVAHSPELALNLRQGSPESMEHLWGYCKECEFSPLCRGGCSWTAHVFFDRRGNNPYCHHRSLEKNFQGKRERLTLREKASGLPFDNGVFELTEESARAPWPEGDPLHFTADKVRWPADWPADQLVEVIEAERRGLTQASLTTR